MISAKRRRKLRIAGIAAAVMTAAMMAGCTGGGSGPEKQASSVNAEAKSEGYASSSDP